MVHRRLIQVSFLCHGRGLERTPWGIFIDAENQQGNFIKIKCFCGAEITLVAVSNIATGKKIIKQKRRTIIWNIKQIMVLFL